MIVVVTKGVKKNFDVVLAAIAALEVRMLVYLSVHKEFYHFAMSVLNSFLCTIRLKFVMFLFLLLLLRML